jgi:hypothetical protein
MMSTAHPEKIVQIPVDAVLLEGAFALPQDFPGLVVFAHGSGSSRLSPRNSFVAHMLQQAGIGTLLMDLLTPQEDAVYETRFDVDLLTTRLLSATHWLQELLQSEQNQKTQLTRIISAFHEKVTIFLSYFLCWMKTIGDFLYI